MLMAHSGKDGSGKSGSGSKAKGRIKNALPFQPYKGGAAPF